MVRQAPGDARLEIVRDHRREDRADADVEEHDAETGAELGEEQQRQDHRPAAGGERDPASATDRVALGDAVRPVSVTGLAP